MNHIRRAAYFNSTGATCLAFGENAKAFKSFKTSLKCLAQAIMHAEDTAPTEGQTADTEMITKAVPRSPMSQTKEGALGADGEPYLYSKGLVFYPNATLSTCDLAFYCSVVVFNLVLTYHRKSKNLRESDLTKLLQLYELCLKLISEGAKSNDYDCCNLMVATLNNKSVVHSQLGQHIKARRMLYHVWDVMKYPDRRPQLLETSEVEGIFLNIYLILVNAPQVAGAA